MRSSGCSRISTGSGGRGSGVKPPADAPDAGGCHAIAEEIITAESEFTLEGYVHGGNVVIYGVIDSIREPGRSSFSCDEYPSQLPRPVIDRAARAAEVMIRAVELDCGCFNIEFFWDDESDRLSVLEINTRISKSHTPLFQIVDGASHHKVAVELAMGRKPGRWEGAAAVTIPCLPKTVLYRAEPHPERKTP